MARNCKGIPNNHCCWIGGKVCPNFSVVDQQIQCDLRKEAGNWEDVYTHPRYAVVTDCLGPDFRCGDYPVGKKCAACGVG